MYRISRIRLAGVGPADARFDQPSPDAQPFEISCLGADGNPADSVVWLENGGGKTVFLALLFHVLRPDRAAQIGNDDRGGRRADIGDFVLAGDVAHVVCEWVATDTGERILTGLVAERRGGNVNRTWYLVTIRDNAMTLDDLVFDLDGRRIAAARFIEALEQFSSNAGKVGRRNRVEVTKTSVQRTWFEVLTDHDLDPALFEYQVRMNRAEGGATSLFRFSSAERFVEFFLELTMNPDTISAVSDELARVAEKVASLPRKEMELAHATGATERLAALHTTWTHFALASNDATTARRDAETLHDRLHAAAITAAVAVEQTEVQLRDVDDERSVLDRIRREADTRAKLCSIALADGRIRAIRREVDIAEGVSRNAALIATAWPRVALHQRRASLDGQIAEVRRALEDADRDAAPLRDRRDRLLRALRRELGTAEGTARHDMKAAASDRQTAEGEEHVAAAAVRAAEDRVSEIRGLLSGLTREIDNQTRAIDHAVASGLLSRGADIATVLGTARGETTELGAIVANVDTERHALHTELPRLRDAARTAAEVSATADRIRADHQRTVDDADATRRHLAAHPLLAELGAEDADLELVGARILEQVTAYANNQRAGAVAAEAAAAEDVRAVSHLERDRLLPARAEVDALCRALHDSGVVSAVSGWRYLVESVPAPSHDDVIARHPAVLEGIVVASQDLDRVRAVLSDIAPAAAVLVAVGTILTDPTGDATGWVVPPAAAMHDRAAAEAELARRRERLAGVAERTSSIAAREHTARALADALDSHITAWPPGTLPAAAALAEQLTERFRTTASGAEQAAERVATAEEILSETDQALVGHRQRLATAERRVTRLEQVAEIAERAALAATDAEQLRSERDELTSTVQHEREHAQAAHECVETARRNHETAERAADGASQQLSALSVPTAGDADDGTDIANLRAAYDSAVSLVVEFTTDSELARRLRALEADRAEVETDWNALDGDLRDRATVLATEPAATDPGARRKAEAAATSSATTAAEQHARVRARLEVAESERDKLPDPEPTWHVEPFDMPADLDELEYFAARLDEEFETARQAAAAIRETLAAATNARDTARRTYDNLGVQTDALGSILGERTHQDMRPFDGDAAEAVRITMRRISDTTEARDRADNAWRSDAHAVGVYARDARWKALEGELSRRLRDDQPDDLARSAGDLLNQTRILESRLRDDIARLDTHRQVLVTSLADAVNEAARGLHSARRKSELPHGLGDWSSQPFLKIGLDLTSDRSERDGRLRRFTNDLLERAAAAPASLPSGADLVCQAVLACAERSVSVDVLKPNKAQRLLYVPITETPTLSGGMRATAAIAMFCTLAKVRAGNRTGRVGVGTLILDNPLGDANATYLVALQRLVARMNDVQLIYTTGVNDMDALRLFPVITRLTNEVGKRTHLAYVVADEAFLKRLLPADRDNAVVTSTRLVRRTSPILMSDVAGMTGDDE